MIDDATARWDRAAHGPCPAPDDLLLAAAELADAPGAGAAALALDDQSRLLFGAGSRVRAATRLAAIMEEDYRPCRDEDPELLSLPRVVETRVGHPLLLAVVAVALLRRAGHPGTVLFADGRWLAAASGSPMVVLDTEPGDRPADIRPVCGHLVGYTVLSALRRAHEREGDDEEAGAYDALLADLPVEVPPR